MSYHRCGTCAYDGCCDGLPYCGGSRWVDAYGECAQCGCRVLREDVEYEGKNGEILCSQDCYDNWMADNADNDEGE